ncbi:hypothetical protein C7974DRAFT_420253 [Boeremia exigua]|uniref:uncharacterized protein n=1 Tax=Boeremia exigua TaxID=749465 RepID=UPI001E8D5668|nr:uncharacterized protein C7974DRAFT_420253 [Boeremia exigua]KAH6644824.1 hypothetical protein C7974DRAFT_420253 [Boeremia exigua]
MASDDSTLPALNPHLYEDCDDEEDLLWKAPLAALLDGTQTPLQAAQAIDSLLRAETSRRLQKLNDYAASHHMTTEALESDDWMDLYPPNASALAQEVIRWWCKVCTAFYPHSGGQDRLIGLLEELRCLPRWMAPETRPDENGEVVETEFWAFGKNWIGLADKLRRERDADAGPYTHIPESCTRWQNLQSAMARVTADGLIYGAPFTALQNIVATGENDRKIPDLDIVAAAQWVIWPVECRHVYVECMKKENAVHYWEPWSRQRWNLWKDVFRHATGDGRHNDRTRDMAARAFQQMNEVEIEVDEEGSEGSVNGSE